MREFAERRHIARLFAGVILLGVAVALAACAACKSIWGKSPAGESN